MTREKTKHQKAPVALAVLAQARMQRMQQADTCLQKAAASADVAPKPMATFDPPVLKHLRQTNLAAYEAMLAAMQADIANVLKRS